MIFLEKQRVLFNDGSTSKENVGIMSKSTPAGYCIQEGSSFTSEVLELEIEKLKAQLAHVRSEMTVLEVSLSEAKSENEKLSIVCAQLESNQTALALSMDRCDRIQQINDVLLMLAETQLSLLLASCQMNQYRQNQLDSVSTYQEKSQELEKLVAISKKQRALAEATALSLLNSLKKCAIVGQEEAENFPEAPSLNIKFTCQDEEELRHMLHQLKESKSSIQSTILPVCTNLSDTIEKNILSASLCSSNSSSRKESISAARSNDFVVMENAILEQEISSLKEARAVQRFKEYIFEKEQGLYKLALLTKDTELEAVKLQLKSLHEFAEQNTLKSSGNQRPDLENEAVKEMTSAVEKFSAQCDFRMRKSEEYVAELSRTNENLLRLIGKMKSKHRTRLQKVMNDNQLECQILLRKVNELEKAQSPQNDKKNAVLPTSNKLETQI